MKFPIWAYQMVKFWNDALSCLVQISELQQRVRLRSEANNRSLEGSFIEFVLVRFLMNFLFGITISFSHKCSMFYNWIWRIKTYLILSIYYFGINTRYSFHVTFKTETTIVQFCSCLRQPIGRLGFPRDKPNYTWIRFKLWKVIIRNCSRKYRGY